MTKHEARTVLDRARDGEHFDPRIIREALRATGDLVGNNFTIYRAAASAVVSETIPVTGGPSQADSPELRPGCSTRSLYCHWDRPYSGWVDLRRGRAP